MYKPWKENFLGIRTARKPDYSLECSPPHDWMEFDVKFYLSDMGGSKYSTILSSTFILMGVSILVSPVKPEGILGGFVHWLNCRKATALFRKLNYTAGSKDTVQDLRRIGKAVYYEQVFAKSVLSGEWYLVSPGNTYEDTIWGRLSMELCQIPPTSTLAFLEGTGLTIGRAALEEAYSFCKDDAALKNTLDEMVRKDMAEAKKKQEDQIVLNKVREGLLRYLSQTIVDTYLPGSMIDDEARESLISLTINGDLEFEGLKLSALTVQELIEEISNRIPEDQIELFRQRTKELINAYTST